MARAWQASTLDQLRAALSGIGTAEPYGSSVSPDLLDGWSDLDLAVKLHRPLDVDEFGLGPLWAWQNHVSDNAQAVRLVLLDGRRIDVKVSDPGATIAMPQAGPDNLVRFDAALAASRFGRDDRLIGLHLTLGILRECLVIAMLLRDRAEGTDRHRHGTAMDDHATEVAQIAALAERHTPGQRPTVVEQACRLYGQWRTELDPEYRPDWSGLAAVISRGNAGAVRS